MPTINLFSLVHLMAANGAAGERPGRRPGPSPPGLPGLVQSGLERTMKLLFVKDHFPEFNIAE